MFKYQSLPIFKKYQFFFQLVKIIKNMLSKYIKYLFRCIVKISIILFDQ